VPATRAEDNAPIIMLTARDDVADKVAASYTAARAAAQAVDCRG
jgi:DNA-binding response OmpR family regulator